jgi:hypothetical protein
MPLSTPRLSRCFVNLVENPSHADRDDAPAFVFDMTAEGGPRRVIVPEV